MQLILAKHTIQSFLVETSAQAINFLKNIIAKKQKNSAMLLQRCLVLVYFFLSSVSKRRRCVANRQFNQTQRPLAKEAARS